MNRLSNAARTQIVAALVEGNSLRSTSRMTGVARNTITTLLVDLADACAQYHDRHVRNLKVRRLQCDEIWNFVGAKAKNVTPDQKAEGWGDTWTWTALDADTKLCVSYLVGGRDAGWAKEFMEDCASRIASRVQITTDGHRAYLEAVEGAFGMDCDYAQLQKVYGAPSENHTRYSPAVCIGCDMKVVSGNPDPKHVSTSFVERQNLSMRMSIRRFTRLTNAFSKKVENHAAAVALWFMYYNFCRIHQTLRVTPAMEAGIATHVWSLTRTGCTSFRKRYNCRLSFGQGGFNPTDLPHQIALARPWLCEMSPNMISREDGALLVKKLLDEAIPVSAWLVTGDRSHASVRGFVDSFTSEVGLVVAAERGNPGSSHNLCLFFGVADNLRYFFGDKRDFAPGLASEPEEKYGDACISVQALSSGSMLVLFFKS